MLTGELDSEGTVTLPPKKNLYRSIVEYWSSHSLLQIILTRRLEKKLSQIVTKPSSILLLEDNQPINDVRENEEDIPLLSNLKQAASKQTRYGTSTSYIEFKDIRPQLLKYFYSLERRLRFLEGARTFTDKLWPAFFTSVLLADLIDYSAWPNERYGNTLGRIFSGLAYDSQILSSQLGMELPPRLAYSLPVPFLVILPLILGLLNVFLTRSDQANVSVEALKNNLETIVNSNSNFWQCNAGINPMSSWHRSIKRAGLRLAYTSDFGESEDEILDDLKSLSKQQAHWLSDKILMDVYNKRGKGALPKMPSFKKTPLHYLYFNYLLWSRGFKPKLWADIVFPLLSLYWFYTELRFWELLVLKVVEGIRFAMNERHCSQQNKLFEFLRAYGDYECVACDYEGMIDRDKFFTQRCLDVLLKNPEPEKILSELGRLLKTGTVNSIDFSKQNWRAWNAAQFIDFLNHFSQQKSLQIFNLSTPTAMPIFIPDGRFLALNQFLQNCTTGVLDFTQQGLGDDNLQALFNQSIPVQSLIITGNQISKKGVEFLSHRLENMTTTTLVLDKNPIEDEGIIAIAKAGAALQALDVSETQMTQKGLLAILDLAQKKVLHTLIVDDNPYLLLANLTAVGSQIQNSALRYLSLQKLQLGDEDVSALAPFVKNSTLRYWSLAQNAFQDIGFLNVLEASQNSSLEIVVFDDNFISAFGLTKAAEILPQLTLKGLSLNNLQADAASWEAFMLALGQSAVKQVWARNNQWDDTLLSKIVNSTRYLTTMDVGGNVITDKGAKALIDTLPTSMLRILVLSHTNVTDVTLTHLALCLSKSKLEALIVQNAKLGGADGLSALAKALSNSALKVVDFRGNQINDTQVTFFLQKTIRGVPNSDKLGKRYSRFQARYLAEKGKPSSGLESVNFEENLLGKDICEVFDLTAPASKIGFFKSPDCESLTTSNWTRLALGASALTTNLLSTGSHFFNESRQISSGDPQAFSPALSKSSRPVEMDYSVALAAGTFALALVILLLTLLYRMATRIDYTTQRRNSNV